MSLTNAQRMGRLVSINNAAALLGGQHKLARALDVSERSVRFWLAGDREISDGVLEDAARVLDDLAAAALDEAAAIREAIAGNRVTRHRVDVVKEAAPAPVTDGKSVDALVKVAREVAGSDTLARRLAERSAMRRMKPGDVMWCGAADLARLEAIRDELGIDPDRFRIEVRQP